MFEVFFMRGDVSKESAICITKSEICRMVCIFHGWTQRVIFTFFREKRSRFRSTMPNSEALVTLCLQDPSRDITVILRNAVNLGRQFVPYARFPTG